MDESSLAQRVRQRAAEIQEFERAKTPVQRHRERHRAQRRMRALLVELGLRPTTQAPSRSLPARSRSRSRARRTRRVTRAGPGDDADPEPAARSGSARGGRS